MSAVLFLADVVTILASIILALHFLLDRTPANPPDRKDWTAVLLLIGAALLKAFWILRPLYAEVLCRI